MDFENLRTQPVVKVLFVCLGNICRSPAAQGVMQQIVDDHGDSARWYIDSAGTGNYHVGDLPDNRMRVHARRRGLELNHICRQVKTTDFDDFDLIVAMDASNQANLRRLAPSPQAQDKIVTMASFFTAHPWYDHVHDPYYQGAEGFEIVLDLLADGCLNLFNLINN